MQVYLCYELMPTQRTAAINFMEPPAWTDGNPNDSDSPADAELRTEIINTYIHYPYDEALRLVDKVRAHSPTDKNLVAAEQLSPCADRGGAAGSGFLVCSSRTVKWASRRFRPTIQVQGPTGRKSL